MRLGEYFEIGKRMKQARTNAGINQREMSAKLSLVIPHIQIMKMAIANHL